jgi:serine phosphatase RsbU (regulator of sigma subunit)
VDDDTHLGLGRELDALRAQLDRERRARAHRLEISQLAAVTSGQVTRRGVASVIANRTSEIFSAGWVMVGYVGDENIVRIVHGPRVPADIRTDWDTTPLDVRVPICDALRTGTRFELASLADFAPWPILVEEAERARLASFTVEPVRGTKLPVAVIALGWDHPHEMDDVERELLAELAAAAAPAFRRAVRTETDRDIASTLQTWLLPGHLPEIDGLHVSTVYEAGKDEMKVGGDWFDVVEADDGRAAIVIGDVVGHDVRAAAEMGQVRHVLASNLARSGDPAESLALTDRYFHRRAPDTMATALVMVFDADRSHVEIASAGHLPPVVIEPGTSSRTLDCGLGPPIGSGLGGYSSVDRAFVRQAIVIGFTDGVVEQRDRTIDESMADFCRSVDLALSTKLADEAIPALTALVRARAIDPEQRDDAAAVIVQAS